VRADLLLIEKLVRRAVLFGGYMAKAKNGTTKEQGNACLSIVPPSGLTIYAARPTIRMGHFYKEQMPKAHRSKSLQCNVEEVALTLMCRVELNLAVGEGAAAEPILIG
jgi:hypothetical protein